MSPNTRLNTPVDTPRDMTPNPTPPVSAIPSASNTPVPGSPALKPVEQELPKRKVPTRRLRFLGEHLGYASEEIVDLEALKRQQQLLQQKKRWRPKGPFRFFDLPLELRLKILEFALYVPRTIDLDPANHKGLEQQLQLLQASRQMYEEAYRVFYGQHTIRLFPMHGKFFNLQRLTVIQRLPRRYRNAITSVELRLGRGWQKPPDWSLPPRFGLKDCTSLRRLRVYIEVDPSHPIFKGFRIDEDFYTRFSSRLLEDVLQQVASLEVVEFDAYPSVTKDGPLMTELLSKTRRYGKRIAWGKERGWSDDEEVSGGKVLQDTVDKVSQSLVTLRI